MPHSTGIPACVLALLASTAQAQGPESLAELTQGTHIYGLAFDPQDEDRLLLATHDGLYAFELETEELAPIGQSQHDFMGFSVDPEGVFYGNGHPETGGNSAVIISSDRGVSWTRLSGSMGGLVDFHQLTVSPTDLATLYGAYLGDVQDSHDAGLTWKQVGPAPDGLIDLAASALGRDVLYAATEAGLLKSEDGGTTWAPAHPAPLPVTFVETGPDGTLYAYVLGPGLTRATEDTLEWTLVSEPVGGEYILHFATDGRRADAVTASGTILISDTEEEGWRVLGG